VWFGSFGLAMVATTRAIIPPLLEIGVTPRVAWFAAGAPVFTAMLVAVALQLRAEGSRWTLRTTLERLRVRQMTRRDWKLLGVALAITAIATPLLLFVGLDPAPPFLQTAPLGPDALPVLLLWIPFFVANILGEELLWRGVLLPRHERAFGDNAWIVHGIGWLLFHMSFGLGMLAVTAPLILAQSWACQRSGNTTVGILHHALVNGGGFLTLAFVDLA
jgi:membrane protease YdiL (CAAX protease family)